MRLGAGPFELGHVDGRTLRTLAERAAAASFDAMWVAEARRERAGGALAAAAMVAQWVPIRAGAVVDAALYHPLHLAEDVAVADLTCQGRLEVVLRFDSSPAARYDTPAHASWDVEWLEVLGRALSGAHVRHDGPRLRIPARLEANQPGPARLAVNPRPAQPAVPIWVLGGSPELVAAARGQGLAEARPWNGGEALPPPAGRWPGMAFCAPGAEAAEMLASAGEDACYFVVAARSAEELEAAGRRLAGPLRMPEFPDWVLA